MRKVKVDWRELEEAFELGQRGQSTYLDARTGKVLAWTDEATDTVELEGLVDEVAADPARYIEVTLPTDSDAWEQMMAFARGVEDAAARERLEAALAGPDRVFRRFKDALLSLPALRARWFEAEAASRRQAILAWLDAAGLEPESPPPW
ncbi:MAG: hypothetical protein KF878_27690 [Planctomycetes bacterium]|nr:hypothetical protein [Planctomycetota bacterium]